MKATSIPAWAETLPVRMQTWPEESQALVHLLRLALGTATIEGTPSVRAGPAWLQLVRRHRVGAFLAVNLPESVRGLLPEATTRVLEQVARQNQMRAFRQTAEVIRLTDAFAEAGVSLTGLKGALLAERFYGRQGVRHAGDIDFVVSERDVAKADAVLLNAGFQRTHPACAMTPRRWSDYTRVWRDGEYRHAETGQTVELMWRLANNDKLQVQVEAAEPVRQQLGGRDIALLPDSLHALYLLVHGSHHGWFRLFWLLDIALLLRDPRVDWTAVSELAERTGTTRPCWQGLQLAREIFGVAWPQTWPKQGRDPALPGLIGDAYWHMERMPHELRFGSAHVRMAAYAARLQPDPAIRRRERSKRWVSPEHWALLPLPDRWLPLHRVVWPALWAWRQVARRWRSRAIPRQN